MRYIWFLLLMTISLTYMPGCKSADSDQPVESTDWKPTIYDTVDNFNGVTMTAKEGTVSRTGMTVILQNNSDKQCVYGEAYLLEKNIGGDWYQVPFAEAGDHAFPSIGYDLGPSDVKEWDVNWEQFYGDPGTGEYRIVKEVLDFREARDFDVYNLTAEFNLD
ncbi:immunoglobulin-like domain-containing protein [Bacillus infantis]|uniref:immunoglobulin-like domain-containing protein n=1 Tax=Bacillus infantis TaxID=324767 RepID=UPI003CF1C45D